MTNAAVSLVGPSLPDTVDASSPRGAVSDVEALPRSWSCSQQRTFDECPRARYWATDVASNGWRRDASELARTAYRLKSLSTLPMRLGISLHARAAECAVALRERIKMPSLLTMRQRTSSDMRYVWVSARDRYEEWLRAPKHVPMLLETHYRRPLLPAFVSGVRERLERGLITLHGLGLWSELAACAPSDILTVDSLTSYALPDPGGGPDVKVWAAPDLVMRVEPGKPFEVVDHKTGGALRDGRSFTLAVEQLMTYAVYLRRGAKVLRPDESCRGRLILLGDGSEHEFPITPSDIDAAEARIHAGVAAMATTRGCAALAATTARDDLSSTATALEREAVIERARRSAYPMTSVISRCQRCNFLELCRDELNAAGAAVESLECAA
jgi:hypothetical protein